MGVIKMFKLLNSLKIMRDNYYIIFFNLTYFVEEINFIVLQYDT